MSEFELVRLAFHEAEASAGFAGWLADEGLSVGLTDGNRLFLVGLRPDGALSITESQYGLCTAMARHGLDTLYLATRYQIWRMDDALPAGHLTADGHDRLFLPQTAWTTGLLGVHDMAVDDDGRVVFVNSRFSCLSGLSERLNFEPLWLPPFVSALAPEDRCHLTGLAVGRLPRLRHVRGDDGHPAGMAAEAAGRGGRRLRARRRHRVHRALAPPLPPPPR